VAETGVTSLPQLDKLDANTRSLCSAGSQVTVAITSGGTRDEELHLVEVSPTRKADQEKGTTFPNKYLK